MHDKDTKLTKFFLKCHPIHLGIHKDLCLRYSKGCRGSSWISDVATASVHSDKNHLKKMIMIIIIIGRAKRASGTDRHFDTTFFRLHVVDRSSLVSVLFREAFSQPTSFSFIGKCFFL